MNLAFGDTVAPLPGEPRCDRDQVIRQPTGETGQFRNPAVDRLGHSCLEFMAPALPDHRQERLTQPMSPADACIHLAELAQIHLCLT